MIECTTYETFLEGLLNCRSEIKRGKYNPKNWTRINELVQQADQFIASNPHWTHLVCQYPSYYLSPTSEFRVRWEMLKKSISFLRTQEALKLAEKMDRTIGYLPELPTEIWHKIFNEAYANSKYKLEEPQKPVSPSRNVHQGMQLAMLDQINFVKGFIHREQPFCRMFSDRFELFITRFPLRDRINQFQINAKKTGEIQPSIQTLKRRVRLLIENCPLLKFLKIDADLDDDDLFQLSKLFSQAKNLHTFFFEKDWRYYSKSVRRLKIIPKPLTLHINNWIDAYPDEILALKELSNLRLLFLRNHKKINIIPTLEKLDTLSIRINNNDTQFLSDPAWQMDILNPQPRLHRLWLLTSNGEGFRVFKSSFTTIETKFPRLKSIKINVYFKDGIDKERPFSRQTVEPLRRLSRLCSFILIYFTRSPSFENGIITYENESLRVFLEGNDKLES